MKYLREKDFYARKEFQKSERTRILLNALIHTRQLPVILRYKCSKLLSNSSARRVHNRCIISGRGHGVLRFFKLSRIKFRELAYQGLLGGVRKSSW